ncbi:MAG: ABC transporter ATP-binding protein [Ferruginibacter sp.]|nr:ABC transporter ATP-binding protein [Ferruginibacter sp.]
MTHLSALNKYFWKYKWLLGLGILFVILTNYFRILAPQLTGYIVNDVVNAISHKNSTIDISGYDFTVKKLIYWYNQSATNKVLLTGITLLLLALISGFFMFLMRQTLIVMSRHIEYDQKNEIYNKYQKLNATFYKTNFTGDLMNRISEDVSRVRMYTGPALMYFINLAAVIGFTIFFMLKSSPKLTFVSLAPLPILALAIYFVNSIINKKSEKIQSLLSNLTTNAQESYSGIRVIKSFGQEKALHSFFKANSEAYKTNAISLAKTEAIYFPTMALLIGLSTLITIMVGCLDVVNNKANVGQITEFVLYIQMLTFPVSAIGWTASMIQRASVSQKRVNEFLQIEEADTKNNNNSIINLEGNINFKNVTFTYSHTGITAIKNFTLTIKQGEKVAIIGKTGSGKTTIAQLLLNMFQPQQGSIEVDGTNIQQINDAVIRKNIGYVAQDVFLFSDTVKNNIGFGVENATDTQTEEAAKNASIHNEIMHFENGYETIIGERGVTLSGGQKQRISIARALIKNPQIIIFDDCLSAVDAKTENEVISNLDAYLTNKTAIIITHRIFSLFNFDKIVILEEGKIVEQGNHTELLQLDGYYASMYKKQQFQAQKNT